MNQVALGPQSCTLSKENPITIHNLPDEVLMLIFDKLSIQDVVTTSLVSRYWCRLSRDNLLWKSLFLERVPFKCDSKSCHEWHQLYRLFTIKEPQEVIEQYTGYHSMDSCVRNNLSHPSIVFRVIKALFQSHQFTDPKPIEHPFIEIKEGKLVTFPGVLTLDHNVSYCVDKIGRRFIFIKIIDMNDRGEKMISLQQRNSHTGDWYLFCHANLRGFRFKEREESYLCCGKLLSRGKIVDLKSFHYLQTLVNKKRLKVSLPDINITYQLA